MAVGSRVTRWQKLEAELRDVDAAIGALYWAFTRTARGKPPCVVRPDLYTRRRELHEALRQLRRRKKKFDGIKLAS